MALDGLAVPLLTLFDDDGRVDAGKNARLTRRMCDAHADHVFALGTMGEFPSLSFEERGQLLEAVIESVGWHTDAWVGCGAPSTGQAVAFANQAEEAGAAALVVLPPYYLVPTEAAIERYYRAIHEAVRLPMLAYNIPTHVGYALAPALVHRLARDGVLAGVKDTSESMDSVEGFLRGRPDGFVVLPGDDALVPEAVARGAAGGIMGSANVVPKLAVEVVHAARSGDAARRAALAEPLTALLAALQAGPFPSTAKHLLARLTGLGVGYRSPYDPLTPEEAQRVDAALASAEPKLKPYR